MASGNRVTVMPRSLMARLTTKNSAGFREDFFLYATTRRVPLPSTDSTPGKQSDRCQHVQNIQDYCKEKKMQSLT